MMENSIANMRIRIHPFSDKSNLKYVFFVCVLFSILLIGRATDNVYFYIFAGVSSFLFLLSSTSNCFYWLLFLLPSASIMKYDVADMSFFTVLFFLTILKMAIGRKKINGYLLFGLLVFLIYNIAFSGMGQLTTIVTMIAGIAMLYYIRNMDIELEPSIISFSMGIVFSSILALLKGSLPIINMFIEDITFRMGDEYALRFAGLQGNPNYYTVDILVVLSAIIIMMYYNRTKKIHIICLIALSVFGIMSVSKSFLLCWIILVFIWFILSMKQGVGKVVKLIFIAVLVLGIMWLFAYDYIDSFIFRFNEDSENSLTDITTGRVEIWKTYIDVIYNNIKIALAGNGLNTIVEGGKGAHNTYLEALFYWGLFGTTIFLITLRVSMKKIITKKIMWIPVAILGIRMLAIGILTYDNLFFYLAMFIILSKSVDRQSGVINSITGEQL